MIRFPVGNWSHSVRAEANSSNALGKNRIHDEHSPGLDCGLELLCSGARAFVLVRAIVVSECVLARLWLPLCARPRQFPTHTGSVSVGLAAYS